MKKRIIIVLSLLAANAFAQSHNSSFLHGTEGVGGGDLCEDRMKIVRDDLSEWIKKGGPKGLSLPKNLTVTQYSNKMLDQIKYAQIICVSAGDTGYPVMINNTAKTCRFDSFQNEVKITCDFKKFQSISESDQYILLHHEFAGLAKIEIPNGADSKYSLSNQISGYLVNNIVKKLSIKPINEQEVVDDEIRMKNAAINKFLADANNPKSTLGTNINQINKAAIDQGNHLSAIALPVRKEDLQVVLIENDSTKNPWNNAYKNDSQNICFGTLNSANFLVLLAVKAGDHNYNDNFLPYSFSVTVEQTISFKRKDGFQIDDCKSEIVNDFSVNDNEVITFLPVIYTAKDIQGLRIRISSM